MKFQTFVVETTFRFPIDMLRYDFCFPYTEQDSNRITSNLERPIVPMKVKLGRYLKHETEPTVGRWKSFGCKISEVEMTG